MSLFADDPELSLLPEIPAHLKVKTMLRDVPKELVRDATKLQILIQRHAGLVRLCHREGDIWRVYEVGEHTKLGYLGEIPPDIAAMYGDDYHPVIYNHFYLGLHTGYSKTDLRVWLAAGPPTRVVQLELSSNMDPDLLPQGTLLTVDKSENSLIIQSPIGAVGSVPASDAFDFFIWMRRIGYVGESTPEVLVAGWRWHAQSSRFLVRLSPIAMKQ